MGISYYRGPTNPDGSRKSYAQRRAERLQHDAERKAAQRKEPATRPDFFNASYEERARIRRAEHQAKTEAEILSQQQEEQRRAAEQAAIPEHERRPRNVWTDLIAKWQDHSYRPDIARKLKEYRTRERTEEKRIDALMAEKKAEHARQTDPERLKALEHLERVADGATEDPAVFARLRVLIDSGSAGQYWTEVQPLLQQRLVKAEEQAAASRESQIESATGISAAKVEANETQQLLNETGDTQCDS